MESELKKKKGAYHHKNLREALLTLTRQIIAEEGQEQVTLRELARRLGVSRTAPYRHFRDKSTLLAAVAQESFTHLNLELLQDFDAPDAQPLQLLHHMMCHYVRFAINNQDHYRLMFGSGFHKGEHFPELAEVADETFAILAQAISQCQDRGAIGSGDPRDLGNAVWSTIHGLASLFMGGNLPMNRAEEHTVLVCQTLISGLQTR